MCRNDFGLVTLGERRTREEASQRAPSDLHYALPSDVGEWSLRAVNDHGSDQTQAQLDVEKRPIIYSDPLHVVRDMPIRNLEPTCNNGRQASSLLVYSLA